MIDLVCNARVIEDIEFFSGAPGQGHWPVLMVKNMDSMITEATTKALLTLMGLVRGVCENSIPRKTLCKCSKPYWSNELTHFSKKLKDARKKYRLQCNLKNKNIVEKAEIEFNVFSSSVFTLLVNYLTTLFLFFEKQK